ncbi:uncharacterized protein VNE69_02257 [Vairimorpha necatrix]|uniref:Uncharacterized protein n=1 Tax=Vairimorpha necatrix TaxID=6039 RepID=A0AAX4J9Y6_9MICR
MMFLLFYSTCKLSRDVLDLHTKTMVKTNETTNKTTVEYSTNSLYHEETSNYIYCNTTDYFSNLEKLDLSQIEYTFLRVASWHVYKILRKAKPFKKKIRRMVKSKVMRRKIFEFTNFNFYVNFFIRNLPQVRDDEYPYLFLRSLALQSYKLIYLFSFVIIDDVYCRDLFDIMRKKMILRTADHCPWKITKLYNEKIYDYLIEALESVVYEDEHIRKKFTLSKLNFEN